jgi:hypothetical protein
VLEVARISRLDDSARLGAETVMGLAQGYGYESHGRTLARASRWCRFTSQRSHTCNRRKKNWRAIANDHFRIDSLERRIGRYDAAETVGPGQSRRTFGGIGIYTFGTGSSEPAAHRASKGMTLRPSGPTFPPQKGKRGGACSASMRRRSRIVEFPSERRRFVCAVRH